MKLSEAVRNEGFCFKIVKHPARVSGGLGKGFAYMKARVYRNKNSLVGIAACSDTWDNAYSVSHEMAEYEYGFNHSADMFCMQANLLARWCTRLSSK
jgi:hypothetical protein